MVRREVTEGESLSARHWNRRLAMNRTDQLGGIKSTGVTVTAEERRGEEKQNNSKQFEQFREKQRMDRKSSCERWKDEMWCHRISSLHSGAEASRHHLKSNRGSKGAFCYDFQRWWGLDFEHCGENLQGKTRSCLTVQRVGSKQKQKLIKHRQCTQYHKTQKNAFGFQSYSPRICLINTSDLADLTLGGVCEPQQAEDECVFILNSPWLSAPGPP